MPLRLVNKQRTHKVVICDTTFHIISMSIGDKEKLIVDIMTAGTDAKEIVASGDNSFDYLLKVITPSISSIDGFKDQTPYEVLSQMEDIKQLREIIQAIIKHCGLNKEEVKNLSSSSDQPIPDSVGNVEKNVVPENEHASTTQKQTD